MKLAARTAKHRQSEQAKRERKALRARRAAVHAAMTEAARMRRSRKKGTRDTLANMAALGFSPGAGGGDVLDKFERAA